MITTASRPVRWLAGIAAATALVHAAGCAPKSKAAGAGPTGTAAAAVPPKSAASAVVVTASPVKRGEIDKTVEVTGGLVALQDVVVGAKSAGRVSSVYLHEGDGVRAGQVVAEMDTGDLRAQVESAQANVTSALTKEQQARATLQQMRDAYVTAQNNVRSAEVTLNLTRKTTQAALQTAKSGLQSAEENLSTVKEGARAQERQQAQETVASTKAAYDKARADLKRYQQLFREQAISQSQLDQTQADFDQAQAQYTSAQAALSLMLEGARPQDLRRAEIQVMQARDTLTTAQANEHNVDLREQDVRTAKIAVQTAISNIRSAEAGVQAARAGTDGARAQLKVEQEALGYAYVTSPISGYVAERRAEPGQQLGAGGAILRIVNPGSVYFQANLSESQYSDVRTGQRAEIRVDALAATQDHPIIGHVTRVLPVASTAARSFTVRIDMPSDSSMRPQMYAHGSILVDRHMDAILVPKDSVISDPTSGRSHLFVLTGKGTAAQRDVQMGYSNPRLAEITSGSLRSGDRVIVTGQSTLQDGDPVNVQ